MRTCSPSSRSPRAPRVRRRRAGEKEIPAPTSRPLRRPLSFEQSIDFWPAAKFLLGLLMGRSGQVRFQTVFKVFRNVRPAGFYFRDQRAAQRWLRQIARKGGWLVEGQWGGWFYYKKNSGSPSTIEAPTPASNRSIEKEGKAA